MIDLALDGRMFINTKLDIALQELDLLFNTENTELIGYPDYGTNFEQFLWQLNPSQNTLKTYIYEQISKTTFLSQANVDVNIEVLKGEYRNIYNVRIVVEINGEVADRNYQLR